ncbi:MAG: endolytic transglycosylase MltG [Spirochaetales bacterium]|nr:endolytic transglycosylase MltG [Spirochaetales bacterium]
MSTSSENNNTNRKKKPVKAAPAQKELFDETGDMQDNRGTPLEPSSRATKILARKAAEEAMIFANQDKPKKTVKIQARKKPAVKRPSVKIPQVRKKVKISARKLKQRRERIKFGIISLALIVVAVVITLLVLNQGESFEDEIAYSATGLPVPLLDTETPFDNEVRIFIRSGMRAENICKLLDQAGVVSSAARLQSYLVSNGIDTKIRSGPIFLPTGMTVANAAEALARGYWNHPIIYIYPGSTLEQIDSLLTTYGLSQEGDFIQETNLIAREKNLPFAEGFYYPDEYILNQVDAAAGVLAAQMYERFKLITGPMEEELSLQGRALFDMVIVASMIQRETGETEEMPIIAGIIWKRLDEGIPLGIDATTRYELNDWSNPLSKDVLENPTPYNTRRRRGLPPTGISNPGFDALQAAAYPENSPYYYYLHDGSAQIHFAITYNEHLENVQTHLR